ncbi:MAG: bis(5'-nucleosyl)-tetraphosphatase (symmetrical) YqeK [Clostridia bacterium]|nr:bis(5'-nucleosyl)-tetraphosphatase (symmetrical) YqeK [Clostridia bacterium]
MNNLSVLLETISSYMSEKRFRHTLGVIELAKSLAKYFDEVDDELISYAAALHDVAKERPYTELVELSESYGIHLSSEDLDTPEALHSFAAPALILKDFPDYSHPDILSAVKNHTLGDVGMSTFDKLIFISDYAEFGRNNPHSITVREYLISNLVENSVEHNLKILDNAIVSAIESTEKYLLSKGKKINSRSNKLKESLLP